MAAQDWIWEVLNDSFVFFGYLFVLFVCLMFVFYFVFLQIKHVVSLAEMGFTKHLFIISPRLNLITLLLYCEFGITVINLLSNADMVCCVSCKVAVDCSTWTMNVCIISFLSLFVVYVVPCFTVATLPLPYTIRNNYFHSFDSLQ